MNYFYLNLFNLKKQDVRYDDDIKKTKELERRKWLQELESQKNEKLLLAQKKLSLENHSCFEKINDNLTPHEPKHVNIY